MPPQSMKIISTRDVPLKLLDEFAQGLSPDFDVEVSRSQIVLLSMEPPSWVSLLAQAEWWEKGLIAASTLYVAEIIKEAAKDTWKNRSKAVTAIVGATNQIKKIAEKIVALKLRASERTNFVVGLPVPNEYFGVRLALSAEDIYTLQLEISLFVHHLPALTNLMRAEDLEGSKPATGLFLSLLENGDLQVMWFDRNSLAQQQRILPLIQLRA